MTIHQIEDKIKQKKKLLSYYTNKENSSIILNVIDILAGGYSSKETYYQIKKLEEEIEQEEKNLIILKNNSSFEGVYYKLLCLKKYNKISNDEFETFINAFKNGDISIYKIEQMIKAYSLNCDEKKDNQTVLKVIAIFTKLVQKNNSLSITNRVNFAKIMKEKFNIKDSNLIDKLFNLDVSKINISELIEEMYKLYPTELEEAIRTFTKFETNDLVNKDKIKQLRLEITKQRMKNDKRYSN